MVQRQTCHRCKKRFYVEELYERHIAKLKDKKKRCTPIKCKKCDIIFRTEIDLDNHERYFCYIEYQKCKKCSKNINTKYFGEHNEKCIKKSFLERHMMNDKPKYKHKNRYNFGYYSYYYGGGGP